MQRLSTPGETGPAGRRTVLPLRERGVCLTRFGRFGLDACAVLQRNLVAHVDRVAWVGSSARHEDHARTLAGSDEDVLRPGRAVDEVPRLQAPLLALDEEETLALEDEEVLLVRLAVVHATRLTGLQDGERVADLLELPVVGFEETGVAHV